MESPNPNFELKIVEHIITGATQIPTAHTSGIIKPDLIVVHETSSRLTKGNVVNYLKKNDRKVSYHVVVERDGEIVQMAPLNRRCHHAGRSAWNGRKGCNNFAIGIGIVGPGPLKGTKAKAKSWFGVWYGEQDEIEEMASPYHGNNRLWLKMTDAQDAALINLVKAIQAAYPGIGIAGHYHVSPGRKVDPPPMVNFAKLGAAPDMIVADAAPSRVVVAANSSTYKVAGRSKAVAATVATTAGAAEVVKELGTASQGATSIKQIVDTAASLTASYGLVAIAAVAVGAFFVFQYVQDRRVSEHEDGRYETEGEA
ncbi:MAG: N-acetylmuramoyl-L-alanine amidase [Hyphomicrobiales bacterium]|nr:N-acetylmuramoyl-L-alanine amidase [Hyphomicrobiales bacterium]